MIVPSGVSFNGKNTWDEFGLILSSYNIAPPEVKQTFVQIPARNGDLDFSEVLTGRPMYGNRVITCVLGGKATATKWFSLRSKVLNALHNRTVQVVFDDDRSFYWQGRATVQDDFEKGIEVATFSVEINAQPYKMDINDGTGPWLWDPFSFIDGIIRNYNNISVNGEYDLVIVGLNAPVSPVFTVNNANNLKVLFSEKEYILQNGINRFYDLVPELGENMLKFTGSGTVTVSYRGGSL